jgi:hypothetical protein
MPRVTSRARRLAGALLAALAVTALAAPVAGAAKKKANPPLPPVHMSGIVYTFDNQEPIAGATVGVAEVPGLTTTSGPDGSYDLVVPDGTRLTPYASAPGHHTLHHQTYVSAGRDINRVNHQIPTDGTYNALAALVAVPLDANGDPVQCAVVSTFSTSDVRNATHQEFVDYGAHGVAGATASATPALPKPTYFNDAVLPDASRTSSSHDGGVIWPIVPAGVYRFEAQHPSTRFAPFRGTCAAGRVVNASPTRGFYELFGGEQLDASVDARLARLRSDLSGRRSLLKVRVQAAEYVSVAAQVLRGKKSGAAKQTKGFAPGKRALAVPAPAGKKVKLLVTVEDAEGNVRTLTRKLRVPSPG